MAEKSNKRTTSRRENAPQAAPKETVEKVVFINRCAKVVKGGRRFSFSALIVCGNMRGKVGVGFGKANEVSEAIRKASEAANKAMISVSVGEKTIPHEVLGTHGGGRVLLRPASPGTGIIAGGGVRAVIEASGIRDILAKSLGSNNHANVVKATLDALSQLRPREEIYQLRGKKFQKKSTSLHVAPISEPLEVTSEVIEEITTISDSLLN
ncbi:MAG: 30S ribosomal protein S5 [Verrucomicrobia bacterium]|jgi:small subunit ribosomal protein S5|nr:MAG: 30S ribosomal protein S5 [Verrucomicrobiota bacterium]MDH4470386.1 30S ribosomal protein S5 [Verrucomicrobiae bacterium]